MTKHSTGESCDWKKNFFIAFLILENLFDNLLYPQLYIEKLQKIKKINKKNYLFKSKQIQAISGDFKQISESR